MPSVETSGFDEAIAGLKAGPDRLREALYLATKDATDTVTAAVMAETPVGPTGDLLAGWRKRVVATVTGATGTITNKVRYGPFVERGNHPYKPMRAQPMVARGVALTTGTVNGIYDVAVRKATTEIEAI